jgi:hypothetical protein
MAAVSITGITGVNLTKHFSLVSNAKLECFFQQGREGPTKKHAQLSI